MNEQMPKESSPEDLSAFDLPLSGTHWSSRRTLAGAVAAAAAIGLGAAGFLFVSSNPGSSEALAGALGAGGAATATSTPTTSSAVNFAVSGRDVFAGSVAPAAETTSEGVTGGGSSASTAGGASTAVPTGTARPATTAGSGSGAGGSKTTSPATSTKAPAGVTTTPTPVRSTAAPWTKGSVKLVKVYGDSVGTAQFTIAVDGVDPVIGSLSGGSLVPSTSTLYQPHGTTTDRSMTDAEKASCSKEIQNAATTEAAEKVRRLSKDCTVVEDYVWQAVFTPSSQARAAASNTERFGWLVGAGALLPDAAMGKVTGTVRFLGQAGDLYLVQAGSAAPQWLSTGEAVTGTPLRFTGIGLTAIEREDVAVFTDGTTQFFTVIGGGEGSGVTF